MLLADTVDTKDILDHLDTYATQISEAITKVTPTVWHTLVTVKQYDSIASLVNATAWVFGLFLMAFVSYLLHKKFVKRKEAVIERAKEAGAYRDGDFYSGDYHRRFNEEEGISRMCFCVSMTFTIIGLLVFAFTMFDTWTWIGVFRPDVAVSRDIITKVLGN